MSKEKFYAIIGVPGDWSVGIPDSTYQVELPNMKDYYDNNETREWTRKELNKLYTELEDNSRIYVLFSDECENCWQQDCKNNKCVEEVYG